MGPEELWNRLHTAVNAVAVEQSELWEYQVGEWAIVAQVFYELRRRDDWPSGVTVDSEWDRQGTAGERKRISRHDEATARPDIIVHRRGNEGRDSNLLVIEFKRDSLTSWRAEADAVKVRRLRQHFDYATGAVVSLGRNHAEDPIEALWMTDEPGASERCRPIWQPRM